jgi:hypothetical protein
VDDDWLDRLESLVAEADAGVAVVTVASVAGRGVELDEEELRAGVRRALLVLTAGGDPERGLDVNGPAVARFAEELETPERLSSLDAGLEQLAADAVGHAHTSELVHALSADRDTAWRAFACSVLAEHLVD